MFHHIANGIVGRAIKQKIIHEQQKEEYTYGLELSMTVLLNGITVVVIGILMGMPFETIGFWLIYNILKKYTGGFHFNSSAVCYISTCIMCVLVLYLIRICSFDTLLYSVLAVVSGGITFALSPVPAIQKPLDEKEEQVFGKIARILVLVTVILYFICILCHLNYVAKIFAFGIISVALFAIAGKIKYVLCVRKS